MEYCIVHSEGVACDDDSNHLRRKYRTYTLYTIRYALCTSRISAINRNLKHLYFSPEPPLSFDICIGYIGLPVAY